MSLERKERQEVIALCAVLVDEIKRIERNFLKGDGVVYPAEMERDLMILAMRSQNLYQVVCRFCGVPPLDLDPPSPLRAVSACDGELDDVCPFCGVDCVGAKKPCEKISETAAKAGVEFIRVVGGNEAAALARRIWGGKPS